MGSVDDDRFSALQQIYYYFKIYFLYIILYYNIIFCWENVAI